MVYENHINILARATSGYYTGNYYLTSGFQGMFYNGPI
jgi:hypothetical protein